MMPDRLDLTWIVLIGLALATVLVPSLVTRPLLGNALLLAFAALKGAGSCSISSISAPRRRSGAAS